MTHINTETAEKAKGLSVRILLIILFFAAVCFMLYYISDEIVLEKEATFDARVFKFLDFKNRPALKPVMLFFTFFGSANFLLPAYILLSIFYLFKRKNKERSLNIAAIGLCSAGLLFFLKHLFRRARPEEQLLKNIAGYSYPSGHSFSSFTFCGMLIFLIWMSEKISKPVKWILSIFLFSFASMVALSRVYFRVHYPSDVIAGFLLSIVWLTICYFILERWNTTRRLFQSSGVTPGQIN
ncbi:MAG: phosphatase PAP2 family protein [Chitinophagaceae bacterium]|nr:phosphatase PAP2 family protein [Chitinophagaceae bacterium]